MQLREYQKNLVGDVYTAWRAGFRRVCMQLATGGGKTVVFAAICADAVASGRRVLILVHREEIQQQVVATLTKFGLQPHSLYAGGDVYEAAQIVVAMVQTAVRRHYIHADVVIVDEAHHAVSKSYEEYLNKYTDALALGVTATPERLDGKGLDNQFDELVCGPQAKELIRLGYLVDADIYAVPLPTDALKNAKISMGDFRKSDVEKIMKNNIVYGDVVNTYLDCADGAQGIVFASSIDLATSYAAEYAEAGIPSKLIHSKIPPAERKSNVNLFRKGKIKILINVAIATEGFDVPQCDCVQMLRPTASLTLYLQMVGRSLRPANGKQSAIILDHVDNVRRHGVPTADRRWSLRGKSYREREELPELIEVEGLPDLDGTTTGRMIEHRRAVKLVPIHRAHRDPLPAQLRALANDAKEYKFINHNYIIKRWRELGGEPTPDIIREYATEFGLPYDWQINTLLLTKLS